MLRSSRVIGFMLIVIGASLGWLTASGKLPTVFAQEKQPSGGSEVLPHPEPPFKGKIGTSYKDSKEDFPQPVKPPVGAPNILLIMLDDVGFGHTSTFGGPIQTPNLDKLAAKGLRYNRFHTTAICSPTRAALLTGRNHHQAGTGTITEIATGYPGYTGILPKHSATIAEILRPNGYGTAMFGKWHNTHRKARVGSLLDFALHQRCGRTSCPSPVKKSVRSVAS